MTSQRSRNARGATRNNGSSGEEYTLWQQIQEDLRAIVDEVNTSNDNTREIIAQDSYLARNSETADIDAALSKLDTLLRGGVRVTDTLGSRMKAVVDKLGVLKAVQRSKEDAEAQTAVAAVSTSRERGALAASGRTASARVAGNRDRERDRDRDKDRDKDKDKDKDRDRDGTRDRDKDRDKDRDRDREKDKDKDKDVYDFDGAGDSPVPSPVGGHTRKLGSGGGGAGSDRSGNRDSVPPRGGDRDTPAKADSVEPQLPSAGVAGTAMQRSKVNFQKGQDVAFKPKTTANEATDWYLGRVQQVLGDGKSRRYKVRDEDPGLAEEERPEYRTSASSMIPIPNLGTDLPTLDKGRTVLAMYPSTTTFYKAAVVGTDPDTGKINLRFDGEETTGTLQLVDRRYVLEYRA